MFNGLTNSDLFSHEVEIFLHSCLNRHDTYEYIYTQYILFLSYSKYSAVGKHAVGAQCDPIYLRIF